MKSLLISTLVVLGLVNAALGSNRDFKPEYLAKIVETARQQDYVFDESSTQPLPPRSSGRAVVSCPLVPRPGKPSDVHNLQITDIEVIGAIGDSLTAANGAKAKSVLGLIDECRGVSWAMGCESPLSSSVTFATILKNFVPGLYGCSTGTGKQNTTQAMLNLADPGDTSFDMPGQARLLVARIKQNVADWTNKWKLVNFFIGGNDLCDACTNAAETPLNFKNNIQTTLDYLKAELPRTLVNLVLTLDVSGIEELTGITCRNMQNSFCECGLSTSYRPTLLQLTKDFQKGIDDLIMSGRYDNDPLFAVSLHHFMTLMRPPKTSGGAPDYSYFAPDCFHFSVKGHEAAATELWNSMVTPHHKRNKAWSIGTPILCPDPLHPHHIWTHVNSRLLPGLLKSGR